MKMVRINAVVSRIFALLLMFQVNAFVSFAQDTRAQQSKKSRLEKEIAAIDKQLKDNAMQSKNAMTALTLTRQKIEARKALVEDSDREIAVLRGKIGEKQKEVDRLQGRLDTLSVYYGKLVKSAYRNRDSKVWYMYILASENLGQAFRRAGYLKNLSTEMNRQGEKIKETRAVLQDEMDSLAVMRNQAQALRAKRAADVELLRKEELQSQTYVAQLKRNRSKYQKDLAAKKKQVEALNREIERIIAASMRGKGTGKIKQPVDMKLDSEFSKNKGRLPWPADGPVVDHFGQHYHPVFKSVKLPFNNGVNIALPKDAPVKAVFDGVVKQIVVMPGYNKCVLVQHGNYFSFYCKLGSTAVKPGDKVKTGQIVGTVDTIDGMNQLHFQIWKGTTPQNPELWLR